MNYLKMGILVKVYKFVEFGFEMAPKVHVSRFQCFTPIIGARCYSLVLCSINWFEFKLGLDVTGRLSKIWQWGWALMAATLNVCIYELPATMLLDNSKRRYEIFNLIFGCIVRLSHYNVFQWSQVKDYDAALDLELDSMDKFVLQCLAFYQVCFI